MTAAVSESRRPRRAVSAGVARLEFARTQELIRRLAPPPAGVALDVGGGSGPYARWLAELGYDEHLIDSVARLVEASRRSRRLTEKLVSRPVPVRAPRGWKFPR